MIAAKSLLFLIGYRGSGKTTVGELLAHHLGWAFIDADALIEERAGKSIREIFATEGEVGFRDRESAVLADVCDRTQAVIATGGGIILREDNRKRMKESGLIVWLSADAATLWTRIQNDPSTAARRPALSSGGLAEVEQLLIAREPLYRGMADRVIEVAGLSPEQVVDAILAS